MRLGPTASVCCSTLPTLDAQLVSPYPSLWVGSRHSAHKCLVTVDSSAMLLQVYSIFTYSLTYSTTRVTKMKVVHCWPFNVCCWIYKCSRPRVRGDDTRLWNLIVTLKLSPTPQEGLELLTSKFGEWFLEVTFCEAIACSACMSRDFNKLFRRKGWRTCLSAWGGGQDDIWLKIFGWMA